MTLQVKDANAVVKDMKTSLDGGEHITHHNIDREPWPTTPNVYTLYLTTANTQYSQTLPANCKRFEWRARQVNDVRWAFETGKVATPTEPYLTLKAGTAYDSGHVNFDSAKTLYFAASVALTLVEIIAWT